MRPLIAVVVFALATAPAPVTAQGDSVRAARDDLPPSFLRRSQRKGAGRFMTAADIAKQRPSSTEQLLARLSGGTVREIEGGEIAIVGRRGNASPFGAPVENQLCLVGVAINDTRVPPGFDVRTVKLDEIVALEFYSGPSTMPPELGGTLAEGARCGLFVLWLKGR